MMLICSSSGAPGACNMPCPPQRLPLLPPQHTAATRRRRARAAGAAAAPQSTWHHCSRVLAGRCPDEMFATAHDEAGGDPSLTMGSWPFTARHCQRDRLGRHLFPQHSLGLISCAFLAHPGEDLFYRMLAYSETAPSFDGSDGGLLHGTFPCPVRPSIRVLAASLRRCDADFSPLATTCTLCPCHPPPHACPAPACPGACLALVTSPVLRRACE